jgi:hypothetical protein
MTKGASVTGLLLLDELAERFVDSGVDRRGLVVGEHLFPRPVGALGHVEFPLRLPLLDGIVVGEEGAVEGALEVLLGVGGAEEVAARPDFAEGVERLAVVG